MARPCSALSPVISSRPLFALGYRSRDPEATALHKELRENKKTFLEALRARTAHGLPRYAEEELSGSLRCGVLAHGFARVRCAECGHSARA